MRPRGSIFKRCDHPKGGWSRCPHAWTLVVTAGSDARGNPKQVWKTVRGSKDEAQRELTKLLHDRDGGRMVAPQGITVGAYLTEDWLPHQASRIRPSTWTGYEGLIRRYILPAVGDTRLDRLRPLDVQRVIDGMLAAGLAPRTVVQTYRVISSSLKHAAKLGLIATNPALGAQPPRVERADLEVPDPDGVKAILEAARGTWLEVPLLVAATTGVRRGELLGLSWKSTDLTKGLMNVSSAIQRRDGQLVVVEPKSARSRRTVGLPSMTIDALNRHRTTQLERRLVLGEAWHEMDLVFERGDGLPIDPDSLTHGFRRLATTLGIKVRLHDLRHSYATALLRADVHPKIVSEALGHSSTAFTMDTYSHVVPSMQRAAALAIDEVFAD